MTPDSWAYWQGSVSLLRGNGYRFFFGHLPITDWPPGYSIYLEVWERIFGVSGLTLAAANVFLGGLAAFSWSWVLLRLLGRVMKGGQRLSFPVAAVIVLYVALMTASACIYVLADNLKYALLPWLIDASILAAQAASGSTFLRRIIAAGVAGAVLMLVHNGSVAFVMAACAVVLCGQVSVMRRVGGVVLLGVLALGPWLVVTRVLGQDGSHRVGLGIANSTPLYYVNELARGIGDLLASRPILGCILFLLLVALVVQELTGSRISTGSALSQQGRRVVVLCAVFAAVSVAALYMVFNLTWIQDPIDAANGRRYLLFLPLIVVPLGLACGARRLPPGVSVAITLIVTLLPLIRTAGGVVPQSPILASMIMTGHVFELNRMSLDSTIRPDYINRSPVQEGGRRLLSPPLYSWIQRQLVSQRRPQ